MTVYEIFTSLSNRMVGAIMIHTQLNQLFTFVDLLPDARRQEQQLQEETHGYAELNKYFSQHHHGILFANNPPQIDIFDSSVFRKSNEELTPKDKVYIIQKGMKEWIEWEQGSKEIYKDAYHGLLDISEVASADFVLRYVNDVNRELKDAEILFRVRDGINWDLSTIYDKQARLGKS